MINKDFTQYTEALELKQLGYPQNGYFAWYGHDGLHYDSEYIEEDFTYACCAAPTYSQAFRWFREKHNIYAVPMPFSDKNAFYIQVSGKGALKFDYDTYEEAELACLRNLIEIVKEKQK